MTAGLGRAAPGRRAGMAPASARSGPGTGRTLADRPFRPGPTRQVAAFGLAAVLGLVVAGCAASPRPRVAASTPSATAVRGRMCGYTRPVPGLGAPQLQRAYQAAPMFARGITGAGTTIAVILPYGNPWVAGDVAAYSRRYGLPVPNVRVIDWQHAPPPRLTDAVQAGWAQEGTLDLEMAHVLAPRARLLYLAVSPGAGQYDTALRWLVTHQHVTVVSYSEGFAEAWPPRDGGEKAILASRSGLQAAARAGVTVVGGTGDFGATQIQATNPGKLYPFPAVYWPASDPLVTAVGGTRLHLNPAGDRTSPDTAFASIGGFAGGAGRSALFARPAWQHNLAAVTGTRRGVADVAMDASPCSLVRADLYPQVGSSPGTGWTGVYGTSVAAPLFAGIVADAAQIARRPLGLLGPALYQMHGPADGVLDVTEGSTSTPALPGYPARPGYDLPTGIGTVGNALAFASALARKAAADARR